MPMFWALDPNPAGHLICNIFRIGSLAKKQPKYLTQRLEPIGLLMFEMEGLEIPLDRLKRLTPRDISTVRSLISNEKLHPVSRADLKLMMDTKRKGQLELLTLLTWNDNGYTPYRTWVTSKLAPSVKLRFNFVDTKRGVEKPVGGSIRYTADEEGKYVDNFDIQGASTKRKRDDSEPSSSPSSSAIKFSSALRSLR